eukprot:2168865-Amphidinium_carterae.1
MLARDCRNSSSETRQRVGAKWFLQRQFPCESGGSMLVLLGPHVAIEPANFGCQVDDMSWLVLLKDRLVMGRFMHILRHNTCAANATLMLCDGTVQAILEKHVRPKE